MEKELIELAFKARENAYVPYSSFKVGAALLSSEGKVYKGCNVECASYGATICAERTALASAVADGAIEFLMIAVCADTEEFCTPCGICRQMLYEFSPSMAVLCCNKHKEYKKLTVKELLPHGFSL